MGSKKSCANQAFQSKLLLFILLKKKYILGISLANNLSLSQFVHHMQIPLIYIYSSTPQQWSFPHITQKKKKKLLLLIMT